MRATGPLHVFTRPQVNATTSKKLWERSLECQEAFLPALHAPWTIITFTKRSSRSDGRSASFGLLRFVYQRDQGNGRRRGSVARDIGVGGGVSNCAVLLVYAMLAWSGNNKHPTLLCFLFSFDQLVLSKIYFHRRSKVIKTMHLVYTWDRH